jgi:hypothetical protein
MNLPTKQAGTALALLAGTVALSAAAGCFTLGVGLEPPLQQFYYPTAILTSPGGGALYVINSDFDIQYTGGTVQAVDLGSLRDCVGHLRDELARGASAPSACAHLRPPEAPKEDAWTNDTPVIVPGPCKPIDVESGYVCTLTDDAGTVRPVLGPLVRSSRIIGAFASSAVLVRNPAEDAAAARLFVTVRGDPSVTYFDVTDDARDPEADPFRLECKPYGAGDPPVGGRCSSLARVGDSVYESTRLITLPVEPVGIAASDDGRSLVTVHQTTSAAGLVTNGWSTPPALEHTLGGLADGPSDVASIPTPAYVTAKNMVELVDLAVEPEMVLREPLDYRPGFFVSYRAARNVDILRSYDDSESAVPRHFLQRVASFPVLTNSDGSDSRGLAVEDSERRACEAACEPERQANETCTPTCDCDVADANGADVCLTCLRTCAEAYQGCVRPCVDIPVGVFVANRAPASLLVGKLETKLVEEDGAVTGATETLSLTDMVPVPPGPSRVIVGHALDADGRRAPRVFVVSFDSRYVVVYDPRLRRIETTVRTGRGPQALAVDFAEDEGGVRGHALLFVAHFTDSYVGVVDLDTRNARTYGSMFATIGQPTPPKESN